MQRVINTGNDAYSEENYLFTGQTSVQAYLYKENLEYRNFGDLKLVSRQNDRKCDVYRCGRAAVVWQCPSLSVEMAASALAG